MTYCVTNISLHKKKQNRYNEIYWVHYITQFHGISLFVTAGNKKLNNQTVSHHYVSMSKIAFKITMQFTGCITQHNLTEYHF